MSKQSLQTAAEIACGVSYEKSLIATQLKPSIFDRIGGNDGFLKLSELFYDRVFEDRQNEWFLNIFSSSTKKEAIDNQYRFFVQTFGGEDLYRQKKGKYTRLAGRHASYIFGTKAANQWIHYMIQAINDHPALKSDDEAKTHLIEYMKFTAHYIVAAKEYMRSDQLSGFDKVDPEKIW